MQIDSLGRCLLSNKEIDTYKIKDRRSVRELCYNKSIRAKKKIEMDGGVWHPTHCSIEGVTYGMPSLHTYMSKPNKIMYKEPTVTLRSYQNDVLEHVISSSKKGTLIEAMTGAGKTWILYSIIQKLGLKTIIVIKNVRLQKQMYADISPLHKSCKVMNGSKDLSLADITIMTSRTYATNWYYFQGQYDLLIVDEAHNLPKTIRDAMCVTTASKVIGLTATPERLERDTNALITFFGDYVKANEEEIKATGAVVDCVVYTVKHTSYITIEDYEEASICKNTGGQYADGSHHITRNVLTSQTERYESLVTVIKKFMDSGMDTFIIFVDRSDHAEATYEFLSTELNCPTFLLDGKTKKSDEVVEEYKKKGGVLVGNVGCVGDGFNVPRIQVGILFYNTTNQRNLVQNAGRARREYQDKKYGFFVDFQDTVSLEGLGKKKYLGGSRRNSIYKELGWQTKSLVF